MREVQDRLPHLEHIILIDPAEDAGDAITLDELRERGRGRDAAELEKRTAAVGRDDIAIYIYTSGTTGPPKGCLISHGNYREVVTMASSRGVLQGGDVAYLFLPLAHAFAKLIQFIALDLGGTIAFWEKDATKIIPNLAEVKPHYFPSVPRMFEKIYTLATTNAPDREQLLQAVKLGVKVRIADRTASPSPTSCGRRSTRPTRRSTRTSGRCSAAASASASPAPRRSRTRSSSSSTPAGSR